MTARVDIAARRRAAWREIVSTVVVVKKKGWVAIAADTLVTCGPRKLSATQNARASKIFRLGASYLGVTGWAVNMQVLERLFRSGVPPELSSVSDIFDVLLALQPRLKQEFFLMPGVDLEGTYESSHMNLLIANSHGIFTACETRDVTEYAQFWATGSGSSYALGALHALYERPGDAQSIAEAAVRAAIEFDYATGGPVESYAIPMAAARAAEDFDLLLKV